MCVQVVTPLISANQRFLPGNIMASVRSNVAATQLRGTTPVHSRRPSPVGSAIPTRAMVRLTLSVVPRIAASLSVLAPEQQHTSQHNSGTGAALKADMGGAAVKQEPASAAAVGIKREGDPMDVDEVEAKQQGQAGAGQQGPGVSSAPCPRVSLSLSVVDGIQAGLQVVMVTAPMVAQRTHGPPMSARGPRPGALGIPDLSAQGGAPVSPVAEQSILFSDQPGVSPRYGPKFVNAALAAQNRGEGVTQQGRGGGGTARGGGVVPGRSPPQAGGGQPPKGKSMTLAALISNRSAASRGGGGGGGSAERPLQQHASQGRGGQVAWVVGGGAGGGGGGNTQKSRKPEVSGCDCVLLYTCCCAYRAVYNAHRTPVPVHTCGYLPVHLSKRACNQPQAACITNTCNDMPAPVA
jgi:hypothetical protein